MCVANVMAVHPTVQVTAKSKADGGAQGKSLGNTKVHLIHHLGTMNVWETYQIDVGSKINYTCCQ